MLGVGQYSKVWSVFDRAGQQMDSCFRRDPYVEPSFGDTTIGIEMPKSLHTSAPLRRLTCEPQPLDLSSCFATNGRTGYLQAKANLVSESPVAPHKFLDTNVGTRFVPAADRFMDCSAVRTVAYGGDDCDCPWPRWCQTFRRHY